MMKPTLADDMDRKNMLMQLAAANEVSKTTAFAPLGLNIKQEIKRMFAEQAEQADAEREHQLEEEERAKVESRLAELSQQGSGGMPPGPGGAPMPPGGMVMAGPPGTPTPGGLQRNQSAQEINERAEQIARQFLQMQPAERRNALVNLKHTDPDTHALVKQKMENLRTQAASIGQQQVLAQGGP